MPTYAPATAWEVRFPDKRNISIISTVCPFDSAASYIDRHDFDIVLTPHLYPAETMTYMKKKNLLHIPAVAVGTDYTCIPFWEETNLDYYVIPHEDLFPEYVKLRERILA